MKLCWIGYHRKLKWGVNPVNDNTEPQCRACGRFVYGGKSLWLRADRFW